MVLSLDCRVLHDILQVVHGLLKSSPVGEAATGGSHGPGEELLIRWAERQQDGEGAASVSLEETLPRCLLQETYRDGSNTG